MARENFEQTLGVDIIWTIVISQSQMLRIRKMSHGTAIKLRLRRVAVVRKIARTGQRAKDSWF